MCLPAHKLQDIRLEADIALAQLLMRDTTTPTISQDSPLSSLIAQVPANMPAK